MDIRRQAELRRKLDDAEESESDDGDWLSDIETTQSPLKAVVSPPTKTVASGQKSTPSPKSRDKVSALRMERERQDKLEREAEEKRALERSRKAEEEKQRKEAEKLEREEEARSREAAQKEAAQRRFEEIQRQREEAAVREKQAEEERKQEALERAKEQERQEAERQQAKAQEEAERLQAEETEKRRLEQERKIQEEEAERKRVEKQEALTKQKELELEAAREAVAEIAKTAGVSSEGVEEKLFMAEFAFQAQQEEDLAFEEGDRIVLLEELDDNWWKGKHVASGRVGVFPKSYVAAIAENINSIIEEQTQVEEIEQVESQPVTSKELEEIGVYVAQYDFEATETEDLGFQAGDEIIATSKIDDDWFRGRIGEREGLFPSAYVMLKEDVVVESEVAGNYHLESYVAAFDYESEEAGDLTFVAGEIITVLEKIDDGWWRGSIGDREGLFPSSFVQPQ